LILLLTLEAGSALFDTGGQDVIVMLAAKQNPFNLTPPEARSSNTPRQIVLAAQPGGNFPAAWHFLPVSAMSGTSHNGKTSQKVR
jgi:hypothetical protein